MPKSTISAFPTLRGRSQMTPSTVPVFRVTLRRRDFRTYSSKLFATNTATPWQTSSRIRTIRVTSHRKRFSTRRSTSRRSTTRSTTHRKGDQSRLQTAAEHSGVHATKDRSRGAGKACAAALQRESREIDQRLHQVWNDDPNGVPDYATIFVFRSAQSQSGTA
jgi:hypothetical protein